MNPQWKQFHIKQTAKSHESWWLNADRNSFLQAAREQQDRMSGGSMTTFVSGLPRTYGLPRKSADNSSVTEGRAVLAMAGHEAAEQGIEESRPPTSVAVRL
jgi:hypothetical protein